MEVRLNPGMNGDGTTLPITVLNDSGSDVLALWDVDLGLCPSGRAPVVGVDQKGRDCSAA